jgi:hypothetical protein
MGTDFAAAVALLTVAASIVAVAFRKGLSASATGGPTTANPSASPHHSGASHDASSAELQRARALAHQFFTGRSCAMCGLAIAEPPFIHHPPALRAPDGLTIEWSQLAPDRLVAALETHDAVCWNCHVAEEFRRLYPDRVTDRPEHAL